MSITVTAHESGTTFGGGLLRVKVLTGAAVSQAGAATATFGGTGAQQASITTTVTGSQVYGALKTSSTTTLTANGSTTLFDNIVDNQNGEILGSCRSTAATGTPGAVTIGASAPSVGGQTALLEILPAGTITEDASSPAPASNAPATWTDVTTASFTPPPGALLVAIVSADASSATVMTVSGGGLTWTQRVSSLAVGGQSGYAGVWTAQIPPAPATGYAQPGQTWGRQFGHPRVLANAGFAPGTTLVNAGCAKAVAGFPAGTQNFIPARAIPGLAIPGNPGTPAGTLNATVVTSGIAAAPAYPGQTWLRWFRRPPQPVPAPPVFAAARLASATGAAGPATGQAIAPPWTQAYPGQGWLRWFRRPPQPVQPSSLFVTAGLAAATGQAYGQDNSAAEAQILVNDATGALATGTVTGATVTTAAGLAPPAQAYPGTAWRKYFQRPPQPQLPSQLFVTAGLATATGTALGQDTGANIAMVSPNAGLPAATGAALGQDNSAAEAQVTVNATTAAGTGTAGNITPGALAAAQPLAYPGQAWRKQFLHPQQPVQPSSLFVTAGLAAATGQAYGQDNSSAQAQVAVVPAVAAGTGASEGQDNSTAQAQVTVNAATAAGTGTVTGVTLLIVSGTVPVPFAQPGYTWRKFFLHPQELAPPPPFVAPAFTVGTLTASDAPAGVLTAATASGGSGGVLTASDKRTGGPGG